MKKVSYLISPLGDSALVVDFGNRIEPALNRRVLSLASALGAAAMVGIRDIVPAYSSITIHYDLTKITTPNNASTAYQVLKNRVKQLLSEGIENKFVPARKIRVPVCYAAKYGWDLQDVAAHGKIPVDEVIRLHTSRTYRIYMVGFLPGFAYMGEVDDLIAMPRKQDPRIKVEAGCVGIAGRQTGIYPLTSPGGWQVIGRTPVKLFDKTSPDPVLFRPGDEVEFFAIDEHEFDNY